MKIANMADVHISPKDFYRTIEAFRWALFDMKKHEVDLINIAGDLFDKPNIGSPELNTGEVYKQILEPMLEIQIPIKIIPGCSHDVGQPNQASAIYPLHKDNIQIIDKITTFPYGICTIYYLPGNIYFHSFNWKEEVKANKRPAILIFHAPINNCFLNGKEIYQGSESDIQPYELDLFDHVTGGHFHRRQKYYIGALCQHDFGDEGNPQGYEIIDIIEEIKPIDVQYSFKPNRNNWNSLDIYEKYDISDNKNPINVKWIDYPDAWTWRTVEVYDKTQLPNEKGARENLKVRIHPGAGVAEEDIKKLVDIGMIIERIPERTIILRTEEKIENEKLDDPVAVLEFYCKQTNISDAMLEIMKQELNELEK